MSVTLADRLDELVRTLEDPNDIGLGGSFGSAEQLIEHAFGVATELRDLLDLHRGTIVPCLKAARDASLDVAVEMLIDNAIAAMAPLDQIPCDECGNEIPDINGGGMANRHHAESCSLHDEKEN